MRAAPCSWFVAARVVLCVAVSVGVVAVSVGLAGCGGGGHGSAGGGRVSGGGGPAPRRDLESLFEDESVLGHETPARAFATFAALGVQRVRVFLPWNQLAPDSTSFTRPKLNLTEMSSYNLSYFENYLDAVVRQAKATGIGLLFTVGAPAPYWALGPHDRTSLAAGSWKPDAAEFGDLMAVLGQRYSGHYTPPGASAPLPRVSWWSIWNEPNYVYLTPNAVGPHQTPYSPRLYRALVDAAWSGLISSGHTPRTDTILIGETAPRGLSGRHLPGKSGGLLPLRFIRALYCVSDTFTPLSGAAAVALGCPPDDSPARFRAQNPGLFAAGGWADHPYSDTQAPNVAVPAPAGDGYADFASLANLESTLDRALAAYGSRVRLPIYMTEYGYQTNPPNTVDGLPDRTAAAYLNQAEYLAWRNPRIRSFSQYLLIDPVEPRGVVGFDTGLENGVAGSVTQGTPKPDVYDAYRMPLWLARTTAPAGTALAVWGCVRPVNDAHLRAPRVSIQFARAGATVFRTVKTVTLDPARDGCYFTASLVFTDTGTVRLSYDLRGTTIVSRTQSITIR